MLGVCANASGATPAAGGSRKFVQALGETTGLALLDFLASRFRLLDPLDFFMGGSRGCPEPSGVVAGDSRRCPDVLDICGGGSRTSSDAGCSGIFMEALAAKARLASFAVQTAFLRAKGLRPQYPASLAVIPLLLGVGVGTSRSLPWAASLVSTSGTRSAAGGTEDAVEALGASGKLASLATRVVLALPNELSPVGGVPLASGVLPEEPRLLAGVQGIVVQALGAKSNLTSF
mmetsp:Transcript_42394/g.116966  ORF Transcript_42394/g.116966 Transcript_42394/m.116966 type:complete len:232 (+) Transcript_42394:29-724(+)